MENKKDHQIDTNAYTGNLTTVEATENDGVGTLGVPSELVEWDGWGEKGLRKGDE